MAHEDGQPFCDCAHPDTSHFKSLPPSDGTTINDALPAELLSLIFEIGCQMEEEDVIDIDYAHSFVSLVVSHVCSMWRAVALGTPALWSYIDVDDDTPRDQIAVWLARSKATPLTIVVKINTERPDIVELLVGHIERWEEAVLQTIPPVSMGGILSHLSGKAAPMLHDLYIEDLHHNEVPDIIIGEDISIFNGPGSTPKLTKLDLWWTSINWNAHSFSAIKSLELCYYPNNTRPSLDQFAALMSSCPTLKELGIRNGVIHSADLTPAEASLDLFQRSISIPSLESLGLTDFESVHMLNFHLRLIHAPNLKNLDMADLYSDSNADLIDFTASFELLTRGEGPSRTLANIESLKLVAIKCESAEVLESFFCSLLNLRRLHLRIGGLKNLDSQSNPFLRAVHYLRAFLPEEARRTAGLPKLALSEACPLLEEICIGGLDMELLRDIVRARSTTLKRVHMWKGGGGVDEDTVGMIRSLGIQVDDYSGSESGPESDSYDDDDDDDDSGNDSDEWEEDDDDDGGEAEEDQEED